MKSVTDTGLLSLPSDTVDFQANLSPEKSWGGGLEKSRPKETALLQNYPNPFNPQATIYYTLSEAVPVKLVVLDVLGREVRILVDGVQDAGYKTVQFDGSNLPSGVYFYRLTAGNPSASSGHRFTEIKKMLLMK